MKISEAISMHTKYWDKFPVFVWEEGGQLTTIVDGMKFKGKNVFLLDSKLTDSGVPSPRNLYFVDEPYYE